jgi:hypothetical protein
MKQGFRGKVIVFMYQRNPLHVLWNPRAHDRFQENKSLSFVPSQIIHCIKFHPVSVGSILILFWLRQVIPSDMIPRGCISVQGCFSNVVKKEHLPLSCQNICFHAHSSAISCQSFVSKCRKNMSETLRKMPVDQHGRFVATRGVRGMLPFWGRRHFAVVSLGTLAKTLESLLSELPELLSPLHLRYFCAGLRKRSSSVSA